MWSRGKLIESATAVASNYRAACRSRSAAEFASKISVVAEECDESMFWLDVTIASAILIDSEARRLLDESAELTAIFTASRDTAERNLGRERGTVVVLAILAVPAISPSAR